VSGGRNTAASVRARLLNMARTDKRDFTLVLTHMRWSGCCTA
jgi:hypothetical protein